MGDTNFIESSTPMVNSVLHATKILDYYASQRREYLSLTEISRAIGLHKTTVYRILKRSCAERRKPYELLVRNRQRSWHRPGGSPRPHR